MEAIILAGGLGTRLKSVISDIPKPMAPVGEKPFLEYILEFCLKNGITHVVLAVSYKWEIIKEHFRDSYKGIKLDYSVENEPLGTGGAIKQALGYISQNECYIINGDTFFDIDLGKMNLWNSKICMALKEMKDFDRYGSVKVQNELVIAFDEKKFQSSGYINGGIYLLVKNIFENFSLNAKFSFEEFMETNFKELEARAKIFDDYFIDIGIPNDYEKFKLYKKENK